MRVDLVFFFFFFFLRFSYSVFPPFLSLSLSSYFLFLFGHLSHIFVLALLIHWDKQGFWKKTRSKSIFRTQATALPRCLHKKKSTATQMVPWKKCDKHVCGQCILKLVCGPCIIEPSFSVCRSEKLEQTVRIPRLILAFTGYICSVTFSLGLAQFSNFKVSLWSSKMT